MPTGTVRAKESLDVIYDGQCRFCRRSLAFLQRLAGRELFRLHDANDREMIRATFPRLAHADTEDAMFVVTRRGDVFRGFFAFRRMVWESPRLYPLLVLLYAPGAALVGPRIYAWVARNRRNLGCSLSDTPSCGDSERGNPAGRAGTPSEGLAPSSSSQEGVRPLATPSPRGGGGDAHEDIE